MVYSFLFYLYFLIFKYSFFIYFVKKDVLYFWFICYNFYSRIRGKSLYMVIKNFINEFVLLGTAIKDGILFIFVTLPSMFFSLFKKKESKKAL